MLIFRPSFQQMAADPVALVVDRTDEYHTWITCSSVAAGSGALLVFANPHPGIPAVTCPPTQTPVAFWPALQARQHLLPRRFMIIPEMLKNAPMFKRIDPKSKVRCASPVPVHVHG